MKTLWTVLLGGAITIAIALSSWSLNAIANMPKEYTTKEELRELRKENRQDHKEIMDHIIYIRENLPKGN